MNLSSDAWSNSGYKTHRFVFFEWETGHLQKKSLINNYLQLYLKDLGKFTSYKSMFINDLHMVSIPSASGHGSIAYPYAWAHLGDGTVDRRSQWRVSQWTTQASSLTGRAATDALAGGRGKTWKIDV